MRLPKPLLDGDITSRAGDKQLEINGKSVTSPRDAVAAFAAPIETRLHVRLKRDGNEKQIDELGPLATTFTIDPTPWRS